MSKYLLLIKSDQLQEIQGCKIKEKNEFLTK